MTTLREARRLSVLLGLLFGLVGLGSSSAAIALPMVASHFGIGVGAAAWSVSGYVLALAVSTPVYGRVSDLVGVRPPLLFGISLMTAGALLAAMATSFPMLVIARLFQGAGAAAAPTLGVIVLSARYDGAIRGLALGRLAAVAASLGCVGPLAGGLVELGLGWRFVMALPLLGVLVLPLVWQTLAGGGSGARLDVLGAVLAAWTTGGIVMVLQSPATGWIVAATGALLVVVGVPLVARRVRRHPHGFLPAAVISNGVVIRAASAASATMASWFALLIAVPAALVDVGWAAWEVGLLLLPSVMVTIFLPRLSTWVHDRQGPRRALVSAGSIAVLSLSLGAWGVQTLSPVLMVVAVTLTTMSFGIGQPAMTAVVGDAVRADVRGAALGIATLIFLVGGSVGSAWVAGVGSAVGIPASIALLIVMPLTGLVLLRGLRTSPAR